MHPPAPIRSRDEDLSPRTMTVNIRVGISRRGMAKMRKILLMLCLIAPLTTACNTLEGVGKDLSKAGEAIRKAADEAKSDN